MAKQANRRQVLQQWEDFYSNFIADVEIDVTESDSDRLRRIAALEREPEKWFAYYFSEYCKSAPAQFHIKATQRLLSHPRWYEVRAWCRGMAKSARSMMEILYLALTGEVKNMLCISNSLDNAERLLIPFRLQLEKNLRIINDYGEQRTDGRWESVEFVAKCGCSFRAIGAGQSPRGTRNKAKRPDFILFDDIDTDEEVRSPDRIKAKWDWIEQAALPTVDIADHVRILFNGNIIGKDTCITRAAKVADAFDVVNIRDKNGKSSWEKNSEEDIDNMLSRISTRSAQQEYFNNPLSEGDVFKELTFSTVPPLSRFKFLICYGDPSPSNSRAKTSSRKAVCLLGILNGNVYIINARVDRTTNAEFVDWIYEMNAFVGEKTQCYNYIENNTLQEPFYQQVFIPLFFEKAKEKGILSISPDTRQKPDKFSRIEGNLEPLNRQGRLIFNAALQDNPHFQRLAEEFLLLTPQLKSPADGADCVEGAFFIANGKTKQSAVESITMTKRTHNKKRV